MAGIRRSKPNPPSDAVSKQPNSGDLVNAISRYYKGFICRIKFSLFNIQGIGMYYIRSGDNKEALQGPLIYSVVLLLSTLLFFRYVGHFSQFLFLIIAPVPGVYFFF